MSVPGGRCGFPLGVQAAAAGVAMSRPGERGGRERGHGLPVKTYSGGCSPHFTSYRETGRSKGCFEEHVPNENVNSITKETATLHVGDNKQTFRT